MEILYPAGVWAAVLVWLSVFGAHALRMRTEKNYREAWGSATLALLPAAAFWIWAVSGEADMIRRTALLIPVGALVGACLFAYAGYVIADIKAAKAQTGSGVIMGKNQALVSALESAAAAIAGIGPVAIGVQGIATAGPGRGRRLEFKAWHLRDRAVQEPPLGFRVQRPHLARPPGRTRERRHLGMPPRAWRRVLRRKRKSALC